MGGTFSEYVLGTLCTYKKNLKNLIIKTAYCSLQTVDIMTGRVRPPEVLGTWAHFILAGTFAFAEVNVSFYKNERFNFHKLSKSLVQRGILKPSFF